MRNMTVGLARSMDDMELVNGFFDDSRWRHKYRQVILERMHKHNYTDFFDFVWDTPQKSRGKKPLSLIPRTAPGKVLGPELRAILKVYPFPENDGLYEPHRCREFCEPRGGVYSLTEKQLSDPMRRMLGVIRDKCEGWLRRRS